MRKGGQQLWVQDAQDVASGWLALPFSGCWKHKELVSKEGEVGVEGQCETCWSVLDTANRNLGKHLWSQKLTFMIWFSSCVKTVYMWENILSHTNVYPPSWGLDLEMLALVGWFSARGKLWDYTVRCRRRSCMHVAGLVVLLYFGSEEISPGLEYRLHKK